MRLRWDFTVLSVMFSSLAISRFVFPEMRNARTSSSRSVKLGSPRLMVFRRTMTSFAAMA